MFKIDAKPTFVRDLPILVPEGAGHAEQSLIATFQAIPTSEANAFDLSTADGSRQFLERVILRLDGAVDSQGQPVAYDTALRDRLLDLAYVRMGLAAGYFDAVSKVKAGN